MTLIDAEKATWTECETIMSINDVIDLHEACNWMNSKRERARELTDEG